MTKFLSMALSAGEWAGIAYGAVTDLEALAVAFQGLHTVAPRESPEYRRWLREYVRTGFHPLDVLTYDIRVASWEEQLACRDSILLAIRHGRLSPSLLRILSTVATRYDRGVFSDAADTLVDWSWGDLGRHPTHYRQRLLRMAAGHGEDLP